MITKKDISFVIPSRDNLKYLKWAYESIRKNGGPEPHICVADDFSSDGTWEWCQEMVNKDPNFHALRNDGPTRLGHTILYDRIVNDLVDTKIFGIYHADMYLCPGALESVLEHIKPKTIVSLTRIEPPLHPDGPEKILLDCGTEPEEFNEQKVLDFVELKKYKGKTTEGIFAPWFLYKDDFTEIGGHDPLYAPQSKEDSDIFNRFHLNGCKFIQTWDGYVYHMTCRGSRFNPTLTEVGKESDEWLKQNVRSSRNFARKWGHFVKHDEFMKPIIPHKYDIGFIIHNCDTHLLETLEPWCSRINVDLPPELVDAYIQKEQPNTKFDLKKRINTRFKSDIMIKIDGRDISQYSQIIPELSSILDSAELEVGEFDLAGLTVVINRVKRYDSNLIYL